MLVTTVQPDPDGLYIWFSHCFLLSSAMLAVDLHITTVCHMVMTTCKPFIGWQLQAIATGVTLID